MTLTVSKCNDKLPTKILIGKLICEIYWKFFSIHLSLPTY